MDIVLVVSGCTVEDTLGTLGSYMQDYFRRDGRHRDGLGIFVHPIPSSVSVQASTISSVKGSTQKDNFATFPRYSGKGITPSPSINCVSIYSRTLRGSRWYTLEEIWAWML